MQKGSFYSVARFFFIVNIFIAAYAVPGPAATDNVREDAGRVATVQNLAVKEGAVSGEIMNTSSRTLRDVQLLIRHTWLWNNEMKPGEDSASDAVFYTVEGDIPAGGSKPFSYRSSTPSASRSDGRYETTVSVAGYSEIIPVK